MVSQITEGSLPYNLLLRYMEILLKNQIGDHFEVNKLLYDHQYGFRNNRSTSDVVLYIRSNITDHFERKIYTNGLILDLGKPFACVTHKVFINKFPYCRFNENSTYHGVSQRFVLGPFYFYFMEMTNRYCSNHRTILFFDNTTILKNIHHRNYIHISILIVESFAKIWFHTSSLE